MNSPAFAVFPRRHVWLSLLVGLAVLIIAGWWWFQCDSQPDRNLLTVAVQRGDLLAEIDLIL